VIDRHVWNFILMRELPFWLVNVIFRPYGRKNMSWNGYLPSV